MLSVQRMVRPCRLVPTFINPAHVSARTPCSGRSFWKESEVSFLNQLLHPLIERASALVHRHVSDETLAHAHEIGARLTSLAQIAPQARSHFIDPAVSSAIDSLPNELNEHSIVAREDALAALATLPGLSRTAALPEVPQRIVISERTLERYLGAPRPSLSIAPLRRDEPSHDKDRIGIALGLAWTPVGGEVLEVESQWMPGRSELRLTGQLGEVMRESAQTALSYVRAHLAAQGLPDPSVSGKEVHIHVPGGAVPKDGPSAGVTLAAALVSLLSNQPLRPDLAMTGEVTLRGRVLAVGGIKEKLLAARRAGIRDVVLPRANEPDLRALPRPLLRALTLHLVDDMSEVLAIALPNAAGSVKDSVA